MEETNGCIMKKPRDFYGIEINPSHTKRLWIGIERGDTFAISLGGGQQYTAPIEKVYATLQRWHAKEHPSGRKPVPPLYRLEKDIINVAKFLIQRAGVSSPAFVAMAHKAFTIAQRETHR
jgi:hypothetical protein